MFDVWPGPNTLSSNCIDTFCVKNRALFLKQIEIIILTPKYFLALRVELIKKFFNRTLKLT